jgi:predicted DNA-binding protein
MSATVPIRAKVTPEQMAKIQALARAEDRSISYIVRRAMREYIERHEHYHEPIEDTREPACVARWPECYNGGYDPHCCRFPKSCSVQG